MGPWKEYNLTNKTMLSFLNGFMRASLIFSLVHSYHINYYKLQYDNPFK